MFIRGTQSILQLSHYEQVDLLRKLVEGTLSYESLLRSELFSVGFNQLRGYSDMVSNLNRAIENLQIRSYSATPGEKKAHYLIECYGKLPIHQRMNESAKYQTAVNEADPSLQNQLQTIIKRDNDVFHAISLFISTFLYSLYYSQSATTAEQLRLLNSVIKNPLAQLDIANPHMSHALGLFKKAYSVLCNSYISTDVKEYVEFLVQRLIELEVSHKAPLNKAILFLYELKNKNAPGNGSIHSLFSSKTPPSVTAIQRLLDGLPENVNVAASDVAESVTTIKDIFARVYSVVQGEAPRQLLRSSELDAYWADLFAKMNTIKNQEGGALGNSIGMKNTR